MTVRLIHGDALEMLATLPAASVQTVVTSPPYFGLRRYTDDAREIGQEETPALYAAALVAVFRELRRVLRDDGTAWLNLGDSYAMNGTPGMSNLAELGKRYAGGGHKRDDVEKPARSAPAGIAPKNLLGIPWMVAKALQEPYYTGRITREIDRVWLAAMIDAEGSICGFTHERKDDGRTRTGVHVQITNSSTALLDKAHAIWPASRNEHGRPGEGHLGLIDTWRWIAHGAGNKAQLMCELYPYLVVKQRQALIAYNVFLLIIDAKKLMRTPQAQQVRDKREWAMDALSQLNHGMHVDIPSWCVEPPSCYEPGWYLRSDIIWSKPNPMPESVTDRPTRSHEYLFLLSKQPRYYYDAAAIAEPAIASENRGGAHKVQKLVSVPGALNDGFGERWQPSGTRNRRTVWNIATQPYSGAHFATMPEALVAPCILAGSSAQACEHCGAAWGRVTAQTGEIQDRWSATNGHAELGGTHTERTTRRVMSTIGSTPRCACPDNTGSARSIVLDPFAGSGTVLRVAQRFQRDAIGIDLNADYLELQEQRNNGVQIEMDML